MAGLCGNNWKTRVLILFFLFISFRSNWQLGLTNFNKYALWAWKMVLLSFPFCLKVLFRCRALFFFFPSKVMRFFVCRCYCCLHIVWSCCIWDWHITLLFCLISAVIYIVVCHCCEWIGPFFTCSIFFYKKYVRTKLVQRVLLIFFFFLLRILWKHARRTIRNVFCLL